MGVVSKGGSITCAYMLRNGCENPFVESFDDILGILKKHDIVLSLGNTMRSGCIHDERDKVQLEEIKKNVELAKRANDKGVQVIIECMGGHVRADFVYGRLSPRRQAALDLALYFLFFIPGILALSYAGYGYAEESWRIGEHSTVTAEGPPIYHFKSVIPIAGALVMLQGVSEILRCILCLRTGTWPARLEIRLGEAPWSDQPAGCSPAQSRLRRKLFDTLPPVVCPPASWNSRDVSRIVSANSAVEVRRRRSPRRKNRPESRSAASTRALPAVMSAVSTTVAWCRSRTKIGRSAKKTSTRS